MTRTFGEIRAKALKYWADKTGRTIYDEHNNYLLSDSFEGAFECDWQNSYDDGHVNLFCSLGEWACNLTDILKDNRFDNFSFENEEESLVLYRFYTRLMLVASELLTDFQDIYLHTISEKSSKKNNPTARIFYFPNESPDRITKIFNFINSTCKHKTQHIHICNDHLPVHFEDSSKRKKKLNYLSLSDTSVANKNGILMPKLEYIIKAILICYRRLNLYFKQNRQQYQSLCQRCSQSQ